MDDDTKIALCREYNTSISDAEYKNPSLLHAKCGAILAEQEYHITDFDILHAIRVHTTGVPDMSLLDKSFLSQITLNRTGTRLLI